jgi:fructose-1,6-bisphosphatase II
MEFVRVTEAAAISCARLMGRGERDMADQAAVDAMRKSLDTIDVDGTVVIGEGERDEAPMLFIGEKFGRRGPNSPKIDVALDPLEGTNLCALGHNDAMSVIAIASEGSFLHAPDTYMDKVAVGPEVRGKIRYEMSLREKLETVARCKNKEIREITAVVLDRPRHQDLITQLRASGCRIRLINDGDISGSLLTCNSETGVDILLGSGGAPEGVISAAAMKCLGGDFFGKLLFRNPEEAARAAKMGVKDPNKVYSMEELARGHVMVSLTGVTDGSWLRGVAFVGGGCTTHSMVMRSETGTVREIRTRHRFDRKVI